jgi:hypothetical protein
MCGQNPEIRFIRTFHEKRLRYWDWDWVLPHCHVLLFLPCEAWIMSEVNAPFPTERERRRFLKRWKISLRDQLGLNCPSNQPLEESYYSREESWCLDWKQSKWDPHVLTSLLPYEVVLIKMVALCDEWTNRSTLAAKDLGIWRTFLYSIQLELD